VSVITSGDDAGLAVLLKEGTADITAVLDDISDTVPIEVTEAVLTEIQVSPIRSTSTVGKNVQYHAEGIFSDGTKSSLDEEAAWMSSNPKVAAIAPGGLAQTVSPGDTVISATLDKIVGQAALKVSEAEVIEIQVTPSNMVEPAGSSRNLTATAYLTNNTTEDVTLEATWTSSDPSIVSVSNSVDDAGYIVLLQPGTAEITAVLDDISDTVPVEVTEAVLVEIQVTPVTRTVTNGIFVQYSAAGVYSDGSSIPINEDVAWRSSDIKVATIDPAGLAQTLVPGDVLITATLDDIVGGASLHVIAAEVTEIQITPANLVEPAGSSRNLTATAYLTNNTTEDVTLEATWTSSDPSVVSVSSIGAEAGFVVLLKPGTADITATLGENSDTVPVQVTEAVLVEIQVSPLFSGVPDGYIVQYTAAGVYSDGTITAINEDVSWRSSDIKVVTIDPAGLAQTLAPGEVSITATLDDIVGQAALQVSEAEITEIQITPGNISEPVGTSGFLTATALLTNGTTKDVTQEATWVSSDPAVASVGSIGADAGLINFLAPGTALITAGVGEVRGTSNVTVTDAELVDILLTPTLYQMPLGQAVQFTADGVFSDGSRTPINNDVFWLSSDTKIVTIDQAGFADSIAEGVVTISATSINDISASTTLTVTPAVIVRIEVTPQNLSLAEGSTQQLTVTAVLSDGTTQPITEDINWQSSDPAVAAVDQGLVIALEEGTATVTASVAGIGDDSTQVTVTPAILVALDVSTDEPVIGLGETAFFIVIGEYSDGTLQDLTDVAAWTSADSSIAIVSNEAGEQGKVYGEGVGETDISATFGGLTSSQPVTVTGASLSSIAVTPENRVLATGLSLQYKAVATYSDGSTQDITLNAVWASSNPEFAEINGSGLATSQAAGTTTISATQGPVSDSTSLTVDDTLPIDFDVTPATASIANGTGIQFTATVITATGADDITDQVVWASADPAVATISNAAGEQGFAQSVAPGTVQITAEYLHVPSDQTFTDTATLEVLNLSSQPDRVEVRPAGPSIGVNGIQQFQLIGFWTIDGSEYEQDLTNESQTQWKSSDKKVASISNAGLATGLKAGTSNIEGKHRGIADTTVITVTDP
jgi:hypothetical protein